MDLEHISECFEVLSTESKELFLDSQVPVLDEPPSPIEFLRSWVMPNKPVVIRGVTDDWPACSKWTLQYLRSALAENVVTVAVTPNGYADAINNGKFVQPEERMLPFPDFLDALDEQNSSSSVFYLQKQCSSFTEEFPNLMGDAVPHIAWASEALGKMPDAVNFWMGNKETVTSMHKDHYENLYCVIKGTKIFTLIPPTDQPHVPYEKFPIGRYHEKEAGEWEVLDEEGTIPWIAIDPLNPDLRRYPCYRHAHPVTVTVQAGETLYIPSLWYHHVQQSDQVIAVNYWYDMEYDIKYTYFKFVEEIKKRITENS